MANLEALAIAYQDSGKNEEAIDCFKKVLDLDEKKESSRYHLARMLVRLNSYSEAIEHFHKTNYGLSKSHLLECLYYLGQKDKFYKHYRELIKRNIVNPLMASIGSHASIRFNVSNNENPFCTNPFNYIKKENITNNGELSEDLITSILEFHQSGESDPKSQPLLSNGKQSSGNIFFRDSELSKMNEDEISKIRRKNIGIVFQSFYLIPNYTALENVSLSLEINKFDNPTVKAKEILDRFGLSNRFNNFPSQLSGGEQQRVAIARSVAMKPEIILADEPTGNLDSENTHKISNLLFNYIEDENASLIMVTHDNNLANLTKRKITIKDGVISENK